MSAQSERISREIGLMVRNLTGEELVEIGVGLIGQGLFRESERNGAKAAAALADAVSSTATSLHLDFYKAANIG